MIGTTDYFLPIRDGFLEQCEKHGVHCEYRYRLGECPEGRIEIMQELIDQGVRGFALNPCGLNPETYDAWVNETVLAGMPIVTYGKDLPGSLRLANVGSDKAFMGRTLARLLKQLHPEGGTYALVGIREERVEGFEGEITNHILHAGRAHWHEVDRDFKRYNASKTDILFEEMQKYGLLRPTAIVTLIQTPMRHPNWTDFVEANPDITFIGVDAAHYQVDYLQRGYVHGLISDLPYDIGGSNAPRTQSDVGQRDLNASSSLESTYSRAYRTRSHPPSISTIPEDRVVIGIDDGSNTTTATNGAPIDQRSADPTKTEATASVTHSLGLLPNVT